jgi:hypothetical protein
MHLLYLWPAPTPSQKQSCSYNLDDGEVCSKWCPKFNVKLIFTLTVQWITFKPSPRLDRLHIFDGHGWSLSSRCFTGLELPTDVEPYHHEALDNEGLDHLYRVATQGCSNTYQHWGGWAPPTSTPRKACNSETILCASRPLGPSLFQGAGVPPVLLLWVGRAHPFVHRLPPSRGATRSLLKLMVFTLAFTCTWVWYIVGVLIPNDVPVLLEAHIVLACNISYGLVSFTNSCSVCGQESCQDLVLQQGW